MDQGEIDLEERAASAYAADRLNLPADERQVIEQMKATAQGRALLDIARRHYVDGYRAGFRDGGVEA